MASGRSPKSIADDLKAIAEYLEEQNPGQAQVRLHILLSDLKELTTQRRHPTTRQPVYPAEGAGFDVRKTLQLRNSMALVASEIEAGQLDSALTLCRDELERWADSNRS